MKSKTILKVIIMILTILFVLNALNINVWADNFSVSDFDGETAQGDIKTSVNKVMGAAISVMRIICTGIALIMMAAIGIKYLMASPGERADLKKTSVQFVVGAFVLFGAAGILTILQSTITSVFTS